MGVEELLKKIKEGDFSLIKFDFGSLTELLKNIKIKIFSDNKVEAHYHYDNSTKTFNINICKLVQEEKRQLGNSLRSAIDAEYTILEDNANKTIADFKKEEATSNSKELLDFFRDKISPRDLEIIRAGLYIRQLYLRKENIDRLKMEVIQKYGQRGNNIVNLCSANYLEEYLRPMYELIKEENEDSLEVLKKFRNFFNTFVEELPFTVFVSRKMGKEEVEAEVINKTKYGLKFVNIHGLGLHNIGSIRDAITELEKTKKFKVIETEIKTTRMIFVRLEFEKNHS